MSIHNRKPKSLYRALTMNLVALISMVALIVGVLDYLYTSRTQTAQFENNAARYETDLHQLLEAPLWSVDDAQVEKIGSAFITNDEIASLSIRDEQQRLIFQHSKNQSETLKRTVIIRHDGQVIGSAEVSLSLAAYQAANRRLILVGSGIAILLIVLLFGVMHWALNRLLKRPVDALIGSIDEVVAGKYQQLTTQETYVELSPIVSSINAMSKAVASREAQLRDREALLHSLLQAIPDLVWLKDLNGVYLCCNARFESFFGAKEQNIVGKTDYDFVPAQLADFFRANDQKAMATIAPSTNEERITFAADGHSEVLETVKTPMFNAEGKLIGVLGIGRDITERKRAEQELTHFKDNLEQEVNTRTSQLVLMRDAAEAANRAKSIFLANMSHELRTPLNAILGFSSLMRKDPLLDQKARDNLDIINRSGEHLLNLINDVLEMSKIEAGRMQLDSSSFDLGNMIRDVTDMMRLRAKEKGLDLVIDQSSKFPRFIRGDEARLRQILINLVGNAVKFTRQGIVTVRLSTRENAISHLVIEIEDTGPGIGPDDQKRLFQPFMQLGKQVADNKGTGLGLAISHQYVQLMGGTIDVESTPGKGSLFRVELPLQEAAVEEVVVPKHATRGDIIGLAPNQPAYRILIVEDQLENQLLLTRLMESVGFEVKLAQNGVQGVQLFQEWHPHLIWMDRRMPLMDGVAATKAIRQLPGGNEVKIVAVTASVFVEQRDEMLAAGMDDFVRKPYRFDEIYNCLTRQLGVQYIYAEASPEAAKNRAVLTPQMLATLPQALRKALQEALESLEETRITAAIEQIATHDSNLSHLLSQLADNFDYPAILDALKGA